MFIAVLFKMPSYGDSQDAPLPPNGLRKVVFIHMEFYSATKKNEFLSLANKWM
jgi:hypothetical protein